MHRNIKLLQWHEFFTSFVLWGPIAILYFSKVTGSYALGLSIFSAVTLSAAIFELPTGIFSDYIGRKVTLTLGTLCYILGFTLYAIGSNYLILLLGAVLEGLARSFYSGNNDALLYDSLAQDSQESRISSIMGHVGAMGQSSLAIAGLLGGLIANWSFQTVMWLSVIPHIICLILSLFITNPSHFEKDKNNIYSHLKEAFRNFKNNPKLRLVSIGDVLGTGMGEASFQFRAAFIASLWPIWAIGLTQVISNMGAALSFRLSGKLISKFKETVWLVTGGLYSKIVYLIALILPSVLSPAIMSTTSIFYGVGQVAKSSLMQKEFTNQQRATMGSLNSFAGNVFFAIFAVLLGYFADLTSPRTALIGVTLLQFITVWVFWKLHQADKNI